MDLRETRRWKREVFDCPECGPFVSADEDGCCVTCGSYCVVRELEMVEAAALLAALDELDALKIELETERRWAARLSQPELIRALTVNALADQVDALKGELHSVTGSRNHLLSIVDAVNAATRKGDNESTALVVERIIAERDALRTEVVALRAKAATMGARLRQWAEREQECISGACAFNDPASPGHSPDCPAAPGFLDAKEGA
jgi:ribosomal protein L29